MASQPHIAAALYEGNQPDFALESVRHLRDQPAAQALQVPRETRRGELLDRRRWEAGATGTAGHATNVRAAGPPALEAA